MKLPGKPATLCALVAAFGLLSESGAAEPAKNAEPVKTTTRKIPFLNFWDSEAWERSSGILFWHRQSEIRRPAVKKGQEEPKSGKNARSATPPYRR